MPESPEIGEEEVHVVRVRVADLRDRLGAMARLLDHEEVARVTRLGHAPDREELVASRAALRIVLGRYLGEKPERLAFRRGVLGKPELAGAHSLAGVRFNASSSSGTALFAIVRGCEVGVDIEAITPFPGFARVAERMFNGPERAFLREQPDVRRLDTFFTLWTLREARLKALGRGVFTRNEGAEEALDLWTSSLLPGAGFAASLAVVGTRPRVTCWDWK